MWNIFKKKQTPAQLSDKQKEILNYIDQTLVEMHTGKSVLGEMKVKLTGVPYIHTIMNLDAITKRLTLEQGQSYIPRSVAFVIDSDGNWCFFYAVRDEAGSDDITNRLFIEALTRTNNQR